MTKEKDKQGTFYETVIVCRNCRNEIDVEIPIGTPVKKYREKAICPTCKCPLK